MNRFEFTEQTACPECGCPVTGADPVITEGDEILYMPERVTVYEGRWVSGLDLLPCHHEISVDRYEVFIELRGGSMSVSLVERAEA